MSNTTPKLGLKLIDGRGPTAQSPDAARDGGQVFDLDFNAQHIDDLAGSANGLATLDGTGKVPVAQIPGGGGGGSYPDTVTAIATVDLPAGSLVSLFTDTGVVKAALADSVNFSPANGFVTQHYALGATATVQLEGKVSFVVSDASNVFAGFPLQLGVSGQIATGGFSPGALSQNVGIVLSPDNDVNVTMLFSPYSFSDNDITNQFVTQNFPDASQDCTAGGTITVTILGESAADSVILTGTPGSAFTLRIANIFNSKVSHSIIAIVNKSGKSATIQNQFAQAAIDAAGNAAPDLATGITGVYLFRVSGAPIVLNAPLFATDPNTVELKPAASFSGQFKVFSVYTDAANNDGIRLGTADTPDLDLSSFHAGSGTPRNIKINADNGIIKFFLNGVEKARFDSQGLELQVPIATYDGVSTAGLGVPFIVGNLALDNHNDANRTDLIFTANSGVGPGKQGMYRLSYAFNCKTAQGGAVLTITTNWTDENSVAKSNVVTLDLSATSHEAHICLPLYLGSGQQVTINSAIAGGGTGAYDARATLEQLF